MCGGVLDIRHAFKAENRLHTSLSMQELSQVSNERSPAHEHTTEQVEQVSHAHHHVEENGCARSWLVLCHPPPAKSTPSPHVV